VLLRSIRRPTEAVQFWMAAFSPDSNKTSSRSPLPSNFDECTRALASSGIGHYWTGLSSSSFEGDPILRFNPAEDEVMVTLWTCLKAWSRHREAFSTEEATE